MRKISKASQSTNNTVLTMMIYKMSCLQTFLPARIHVGVEDESKFLASDVLKSNGFL